MKRVEHLLIALALTMLGWGAWNLIESRHYQATHAHEFEPNAAGILAPRTSSQMPHRAAPEGTAIGKIEIPRIGVSAIVAEGEEESTLRLAVGHIPGTASPGESGNVGLAGHRDSFFRPLARIQLHDDIRLSAAGGVASLYRVDSIAVVEPADISVLKPGSIDSVTLITCYPFRFVGAAPKRFVVKAGRVPSGSLPLSVAARGVSAK
jgi:sortase A